MVVKCRETTRNNDILQARATILEHGVIIAKILRDSWHYTIDLATQEKEKILQLDSLFVAFTKLEKYHRNDAKPVNSANETEILTSCNSSRKI